MRTQVSVLSTKSTAGTLQPPDVGSLSSHSSLVYLRCVHEVATEDKRLLKETGNAACSMQGHLDRDHRQEGNFGCIQ